MQSMQLFLLLLQYFCFLTHSEYSPPPITIVTVASPLDPYATAIPPRFEKPNHKGFWLTTDLLAAEFRKGCLSTALCHEPKFKLINTMTVNGEQSVMSWPANSGGDLVQDHARSFVTYWTQGDPEDISLSCQIAGTDPAFGFSRICDETPPKRVFNEALLIQRSLNGNSRWQDNTIIKTIDGIKRYQRSLSARDSSDEYNVDKSSQIIVELHGRCFNATLAIRKHLKRCPWCPDPNLDIVVAGQQFFDKDDLSVSSSFQQKIASDNALFIHNLIILALSGALVFGFTGFSCALIMHCRYRKRQKRKTGSSNSCGTKPNRAKRLLKFAPLPSDKQKKSHKELGIPVVSPPQMHKIVEPNNRMQIVPQSEQRYETPWETKYRPIPPQWADIDGNSHYQTLTITRSDGVSNNYNCIVGTTEVVGVDNLVDYPNSKIQYYESHKPQQSSSSIAASSARSNISGGSSGNGSGASTSATTIGCGSIESPGCHNSCCVTSVNGNCVSIPLAVNHPGAAAALASLKQVECNRRNCGTLNKTTGLNVAADYNRLAAGNGKTLPPQSITNHSGFLQHHHYQQQHPQFSPPTIPPPSTQMVKTRHDDSGMDSV